MASRVDHFLSSGDDEASPVRQTIRELVDGIAPIDALEAEHRADALDWIDSGVEIFRLAKPATPPKHLVAYCLLVDWAAESVLLVDHRDAQRWLPTGGHVDVGEHPAAAARREMEEELGIAPPFLGPVGAEPFFVTVLTTAGRSQSHVDVSLWFLFEGSVGQPISPDEGEFAGVEWWAFDDITPDSGADFDPHLPRLITKFRRHLS